MKDKPSLVYLVEDDEVLRLTITTMIESLQQTVVSCASANEFLQAIEGVRLHEQIACLILDVRLPGMNGMELQGLLAQRNVKMPVIFITGHGDIPMAVQAMERGAFGFLEKPFREQELLEKVSSALLVSANQQKESEHFDEFEKCLHSLTKRERMIFELVVAGKMNKVIASELHISERTVEVHRSNFLKKFNSQPLASIIKAYIDYQSYNGETAANPAEYV